MELTYTWKLTGVRKTNTEALAGVVIGVSWECKGTDEEGHSGVFSGITPFNLSEAGGENFIPFEELTEELVLGWVQSVVVGGYKEHIDGQIMKQIGLQKNPVVYLTEAELPWAANAQQLTSEEFVNGATE